MEKKIAIKMFSLLPQETVVKKNKTTTTTTVVSNMMKQLTHVAKTMYVNVCNNIHLQK